MTSPALDDAEQELAELPRTFFSSVAAAYRLGMSVDDARRLLAAMEAESLALRVCRDGWVLTWHYRPDVRTAPTPVAYLDDMMRHLGVRYFVSYAAAAEMRGVAPYGAEQQRVNVESHDLAALELRHVAMPRSSAIRFHQISPGHGRPVAIMRMLSRSTTANGVIPRTAPTTVLVATAETILLDMMELPERSGGPAGIITIAQAMLRERSLHPRLLAEAASRYPSQVAQRTGSMLQQLRSPRHWISLRPLLRHVRSAGFPYPVAMHDGIVACCGKPDRWGVIGALLDGPPFGLSKPLRWPRWGRQAAPPWLRRLMVRRVPTSRRAMRLPDRCRSLSSPMPDRDGKTRTVPDAGFDLTAHG